MRKQIYLILMILLFVLPVSSTLDSSSYNIEYGGERLTVTIEDNQNGPNTVNSYTFQACGEYIGGGGSVSINLPVSAEFKVPQDANCPLGSNEISASVSTTGGSYDVGSAELNVEPKGDMDPHVSEYLYAVVGVKKDECTFSNPLDPGIPTCEKREVLRHFFLSDDKHPEWTGEGFFNSNSDQYGEDNNILVKNPQHLVSGTGGWEAGIGNTTSQSLGGLIWIDSDYYTGCPTESPNACSVWAHPFVTTNKYKPGNLFSGAESMSPLHTNGEYDPQGEIIFGNYPEYYQGTYSGVVPGDNNQVQEKFFVCREGATMENGYTNEQVPQVVEAKGQLYQCDLNQGDWNEVSECEDGLDNDGDGTADHHSVNLNSVSSDNSCSSKDDSEDGSQPQECAEVFQNNAGEIVYRFSGSNSDTCNRVEKLSTFQGYKSGHNIDTFTCNLTSGTVVAEDFDNQDGDLSRANQFCSSTDLHSGQNIDTEEVKAVEFLPKKELFTSMDGISDGIPVSEIIPSGWQGQLYFGPDGWRTGMQTLHQAEEFYSGPSSEAHDIATWSNKGMKNIQDYGNGPEAQEGYKDAWESSNAGTVSTGDTPVSDPSFLGGFHGKCTGSNSWEKGEEWGCIGDGMVLELFGNSPANNPDNNTAIRLTEQEASKWESYTGTSATPSNSQVSNLKIKARCWNGNPDQRPSDSSKILVMSKEVTGGDTILAGHVPANSELKNNGVIGDQDTVTCNFGFQQRFDSEGPLTGATDVFYDGEFPNPIIPPFYIVEGSNENGVVSATTVGVSVPDNFDFDEAAASTDNPEPIGFFQHFPTGTGSGPASGGDSGGIRNPLDNCIYNLNKC